MNTRIPYLLAASIAACGMIYFTTAPGLSASPVVTVTSIDGQQFDMATTGGKARLVSFYSPDCPISQRDIPFLKEAHSRLSNNQLDVIAVAMPYDGAQQIAQLKASEEIQYSMAHDTDGSISAAFPNVRFTPTTFLIDTDGKIVWRHVGRLTSASLNDEIDTLLSPQHLAGKE